MVMVIAVSHVRAPRLDTFLVLNPKPIDTNLCKFNNVREFSSSAKNNHNPLHRNNYTRIRQMLGFHDYFYDFLFLLVRSEARAQRREAVTKVQKTCFRC